MDIREIFRLITYFGNVILAINVFLFFKSYRKKTIAFKIIAFYLLYVLIIQLRMSYLALSKTNNLVYTHYYFIGQLLFLSFFFIKEFKSKLLSNIIKVYLVFVFIFLTIYYYLFPEVLGQHNIYEVLVTSIPLIAYSFAFLIKKIEDSNKNFIYFNSGLFLYILCSTLIFVAGNLKADIKIYLWYSNISLYLIYQLLITLEWFKNFRKLVFNKFKKND
jgi:hypothetical protein